MTAVIALPSGLFAAPRIEMARRVDGAVELRSTEGLPAYPRAVGEDLERWAARAPDRLFLAARRGDGWCRVSYGQAAARARSIGQALLDRGLSADRPILVVAENGIDHALLMLGAFHVGVPVAPVSTAYSRLSRDYAKLRTIVRLVAPGLVYVDDAAVHAGALAAIDLAGVELVVSANAGAAPRAATFEALTGVSAGPAVEAAFEAIVPDTVAKILFTSGSTGAPKAVPNTHRMLAANQSMLAACWPFLTADPPALLDWLPWSHTFGGNHNFNMVLRHGGTLWIDDGRPAPGAIERTAANLRDVSPTVYFNVPRGYALLLDQLEADPTLAERFFRSLHFAFYAAAALPQTLWERLDRLARRVRGGPVPIVSAWGLTETAPASTLVHFPIDRAGNVGVPLPGCELKLVPDGDKLEIRVRGPHVMRGYWRQPELDGAAFDEEGFFRTGDAARLADPDDPCAGILFDGRIGENFKLLSGTWVHVGELRVAVVGALAPLADDLVVTGHGRDEVGVMIFPNVAACRRLACEQIDAPAAALVAHPVLRAEIAARLARFNATAGGSSSTIRRALLLAEPPSADANEINDKGYLNQRAVLERRATCVERLHDERDDPAVIFPDALGSLAR